MQLKENKLPLKEKKRKKKTSDIGFDEIFKNMMADYFKPFAKVITNYEILALPKTTDLLIIEADMPISENVKLFTYFKKFNIIEFKYFF